MKIVILGCGRVGARLAQLMEEDGYQVGIIDADAASFERLPAHFKGETTLGTGIDVDVLKSAGIESADTFAAVTNFDNTNIMACQVAREIFGVKKVLARIYDPGRENLYHHLGLETVCPTTLISTTARDILRASEGVEILPFPPHTGGMDNTGNAQGNIVAHLSQAVSASNASNSAHTSSIDTQIEQQAPQPLDGQHTDKDPNNGRGIRGLFRH